MNLRRGEMDAEDEAPFCILLVQSDPSSRRALRVALEKAGAHVIVVDSAAVAIVRLRWRHFDLVVWPGPRGQTPQPMDFQPLVEGNGLASSEGWVLYEPRDGLKTKAILVVPFIDVAQVAAAMIGARPYVGELSS